MKTIYSAVIIFLTALSVNAQVTYEWSCIYDNPPVRDVLEKTIVNNQGTVFLAGNKLMSGSRIEPFIAKISGAGSLQYSRSFSHPYGDNPNGRGCWLRSAEADNLGNVIATGFIDSGIGISKGFIVKYDPLGDTLWGRFAGIGDTLGNCSWGDIKIDNSGNIFVTGESYKYNPYRIAFITAKYNSNGVLQWLRAFTPPVIYDLGQGVKNFLETDASGNIYAATTFKKTSSGDSQDMLFLKYNSSGSLLWSKIYNGTGDKNDLINDLALDGSGNAYAAGLSYNISNDAELTCIKLNSSTGTVEWAFNVNGTGTFGNDELFGVSVSANNEIYLAGTINNTSTFYDAILIKLNSSGVEQWRKVESDGGDEKAVDVKTDPSGVYTVSSFTGGTNSVKTRKFNHTGDTLWSTTYHVNSHTELAKYINVGPGNNVYVSGNENFVNSGYVFVVRYTNFITGVSPVNGSMPENFSLSQNYPNPFNPATNIEIHISKTASARLEVFNAAGQKIEELLNKQLQPGNYSILFDASAYPSGAYFYRLTAGDLSETRKMLLIK